VPYRPQLISAFEQAAWVVGGELTIDPGFGDARELPVIEATVEGVAVTATIERSGLGQFFRTVVRAPARGALGLSLAIDPGGGSHRQTRDPEFDSHYTVKTNDDEYARLWLDDHVRRRIRNAHEIYSPARFAFELADERALARRRNLEDDHEPLVRAMNAVAALAGRGRRLLRDWRELADRLGGTVVAQGTWRPDTRAHINLRLGGARIVIDSIHGAIAGADTRRCLLTRVSCPRATAEPDTFALVDRRQEQQLVPHMPHARIELTPADSQLASRYRILCQTRERMVQRLDDTAVKLVLAIRPACILGNPSQVSVLLFGFVDDPERLREAMALARQLAVQIDPSGLAGPYR
jgi:hypothetical protein